MTDIFNTKIDPSTDGPIPAKDDIRSPDILASQRQRQVDNSIGGIDPVPVPRPTEIPEPPQIAPPLPSIDFGGGFIPPAIKPEEQTREIARQEFFDLLKNVTINGQPPSMDGSFVSFNIPTQPSANEVFAAQNIVIAEPPQPPSISSFSLDVPLPTQQAAQSQPQESGITNFARTSPDIFQQVETDASSPTPPLDLQSLPIVLDADVVKVQDAYQSQENTRARIDETSFDSSKRMADQAEITSRTIDNEPKPIEEYNMGIHTPPSLSIDGPSIPPANPQPPDRSPPSSTPPDKGPTSEEPPRGPRRDDYEKPELTLERRWRDANEPFPPLIRFTICVDGQAKAALIPAFLSPL